jgi:hypothetical protein
MKSIKSLGIAAALLFTSLSGFSADITKPDNIRQTVAKILKSSSLTSEKFVVNFLVNSNDEIIVVSTSSKENENAIKNLLNYAKVEKGEVTPNTIYTLPITIDKK